MVPAIFGFSAELGTCNFLALLENPEVEEEEDEKENFLSLSILRKKINKGQTFSTLWYTDAFLENPRYDMLMDANETVGYTMLMKKWCELLLKKSEFSIQSFYPNNEICDY